MSYILDALKKAEQEKVKKTMPGGMTSISGDLFQERIQQPAGGGAWKIIALIVVASLATFAGTWFMLKGDKWDGAVAPHPAAPPAAQVVTPTVSSTNSTAVPDAVAERPLRTGKKSALQHPAAAPQQPRPVVQTIQAPADIKLSGIAWQDERTARRAVVNGFLVKEGGVVSGARITEILADRVRFSLPLGIVEIRLDAAVPAEVKR